MRLPLVGPLFEARETLFGRLVEEVERKVDRGVDYAGEDLIQAIRYPHRGPNSRLVHALPSLYLLTSPLPFEPLRGQGW